jgi:predicted ester cyclase
VPEVHDIVADVEQQKAVLVFTINATQKADFHGFPASGRRVATPSAFAFHFKNGKIFSERRLYDYGGFLMQLGILKTRSV